ncbi:protein tyrosine phosphatase type IVA 3 [Polychytrium aggregatum]|uniref:protein tyrosine phosphatase type IVA 3 n=1 Tax=Polychytrium aggregatum TaxID=110093 RepID=UPI0022FF0141|nr:protein tyrosine phosphatase type IVA 3 [Polychytrium aggregatum]KAI9209924.1 protein tyrosine phosphatase type IVA 3 [Polychytrium aggregatum]
MPRLPGIFSEIQFRNMSFLIMDCPTESNTAAYLEALKIHHSTVIIRLCEPTYSKDVFESQGIAVVDLLIKDGGVPTNAEIETFLTVCTNSFGGLGVEKDPSATVAVHCVAGLGRAPLMVCIALIEAGMPADEAVALIRAKRRGAFNPIQTKYLLEEYRPRKRTSLFGRFQRGSTGALNQQQHEDKSGAAAISGFRKLFAKKVSSESSSS